MTKYIAKQDIPWAGVLAYTRGQAVDSDAVERNGWQDLVVGAGTKEARQIHADITGEPVEEPSKQQAAASADKKG